MLAGHPGPETDLSPTGKNTPCGIDDASSGAGVVPLDADDAHLLDATLSRVAADLRDLGDTSNRDTRRATAVGILLLLTSLTFAIGMVSKTSCAEATWN